MDYQISVFFAGLFALLQLPITMAVGIRRSTTGIMFLHDGDDVLLRRIRAHANYTETVPITLIAMAAAEFGGAPDALLWSGGAFLLAGRTLHYYVIVFTAARGWPRALAMLLTFAAMTGLGGYALYAGFAG